MLSPGNEEARGWTSCLQLPPSPPYSPNIAQSNKGAPTLNASILFEVVRRRRTGRITGIEELAWAACPLTLTEHDRFVELLEADQELAVWYTTRFRHDWDPEAELYTFRMPTPLHELFLRSFIGEICRQINHFAQSSEELNNVIGKITDGGSPSIRLNPAISSSQEDTSTSFSSSNPIDETEDRPSAAANSIIRCPDGTLFYPGHGYPAAVLEVSYSQKRKDLPYLADSYIVDSQHEIHTVIGIDIEYTRPTRSPFSRPTLEELEKQQRQQRTRNKTATLSYWIPHVTIDDDDGAETGTSQALLDLEPFRSSTGVPMPGNLEMPVTAFLPTAVVAALAQPLKRRVQSLFVNISYARLCDMLERAEAMHDAIKQRGSKRVRAGADAGSASERPRKWRKRKRTPSEELSEGTEARFTEREARDEEREAGRDEAFELSRKTRPRKERG